MYTRCNCNTCGLAWPRGSQPCIQCGLTSHSRKCKSVTKNINKCYYLHQCCSYYKISWVSKAFRPVSQPTFWIVIAGKASITLKTTEFHWGVLVQGPWVCVNGLTVVWIHYCYTCVFPAKTNQTCQPWKRSKSTVAIIQCANALLKPLTKLYNFCSIIFPVSLISLLFLEFKEAFWRGQVISSWWWRILNPF